MSCDLSIVSTDGTRIHYFLPSTPPAARHQLVSSGQQVMYYSDPETTIGFAASASGAQGLYVGYSFSGYLEDFTP